MIKFVWKRRAVTEQQFGEGTVPQSFNIRFVSLILSAGFMRCARFIKISGWWQAWGLCPNLLAQEYCHGFIASWESSICEIKLSLPGFRVKSVGESDRSKPTSPDVFVLKWLLLLFKSYPVEESKQLLLSETSHSMWCTLQKGSLDFYHRGLIDFKKSALTSILGHVDLCVKWYEGVVLSNNQQVLSWVKISTSFPKW